MKKKTINKRMEEMKIQRMKAIAKVIKEEWIGKMKMMRRRMVKVVISILVARVWIVNCKLNNKVF